PSLVNFRCGGHSIRRYEYMSYTSAKQRPQYTYDANLLFRDAYAATSSAAAQVDSNARVVDLGTGFVAADMVIDVSAAAVDGGDDAYLISVELSDDDDCSTGKEFRVASLQIGDAAVIGGDTDMTTGRYVLPFNNRSVDGDTYRYARIYT